MPTSMITTPRHQTKWVRGVIPQMPQLTLKAVVADSGGHIVPMGHDTFMPMWLISPSLAGLAQTALDDIVCTHTCLTRSDLS
jgi:hypothetical protein